MSIKKILLTTFGLLGLMIVVLLTVSLFSSYQSRLSTNQLVNDHEISRNFTLIAVNAQAIRRFEKEYFIYIDHEKREKYWGEWSETAQKIAQLLNELKQQLPATEQDVFLEELKSWQMALDFYTSEFTKLNDNVLAGRISTTLDGNLAIQDGKNEFRTLLNGVDAAIADVFVQAQTHAKSAKTFDLYALVVISIVSIVAVFVALISIITVPKRISFPIVQLTELTTSISKGKANETVKVVGSPEIVELSKSVERLRVATNGLMARYQTSKGQYESLRDKVLEAKKRRQAKNN